MSDPNEITVKGNPEPPNPVMAGLETLGGIASSAIGYASARKQEQFQKNMSNTAHQREIRDLEKAGLNPILSATGGSGASTPMGTMFTPDNPLRGITQNLINTRLARSQLSQNAASIRNLDADSKQKATQSALNSANAYKAAQDAEVSKKQLDLITSQLGLQLQQTRQISAGARSMELGNIATEAQKKIYDTWVGKNVLPWVQAIFNPITPHVNVK